MQETKIRLCTSICIPKYNSLILPVWTSYKWSNTVQVLWCLLLSLNITLETFSMFLHVALAIHFHCTGFHIILFSHSMLMSTLFPIFGYYKRHVPHVSCGTHTCISVGYCISWPLVLKAHVSDTISNQNLWQRKHDLECQVWHGANLPVQFHKLLNFSPMDFHFFLLAYYSLCLVNFTYS